MFRVNDALSNVGNDVNCRDLRELYASHNTLTELPGSLHGLTALQVLDLSFNKLNILSPETLSSLSALLELKLVRNRIRELREGAFDGLPRLTLIDLENNDLRIIERNAIKALPELQAIRLGKNRLQVVLVCRFLFFLSDRTCTIVGNVPDNS